MDTVIYDHLTEYAFVKWNYTMAGYPRPADLKEKLALTFQKHRKLPMSVHRDELTGNLIHITINGKVYSIQLFDALTDTYLISLCRLVHDHINGCEDL